MVDPQRHAHILTPRTCECDLIWEEGRSVIELKISRGDDSGFIQQAPYPVASVGVRGRRGALHSGRQILKGCSYEPRTPGATGSWKKQGRTPTEPLEIAQHSRHLCFRLLVSRAVRESIFVVSTPPTPFVLICSGSPRKLAQYWGPSFKLLKAKLLS